MVSGRRGGRRSWKQGACVWHLCRMNVSTLVLCGASSSSSSTKSSSISLSACACRARAAHQRAFLCIRWAMTANSNTLSTAALMTATSAPPCRRTEARPPDVTNTRRPAASHHPARRRPSATTDQFCACADPCAEIEIHFLISRPCASSSSSRLSPSRPHSRRGSRLPGAASIHPSIRTATLSLSLSLSRTHSASTPRSPPRAHVCALATPAPHSRTNLLYCVLPSCHRSPSLVEMNTKYTVRPFMIPRTHAAPPGVRECRLSPRTAQLA